MKVVFTPFSIGLGLLAGLIGKKIFEQIWGLIDKDEPPESKHRDFEWKKLIAALIVEGAIFRLIKGLTDQGARRGFARLTGTWPGEERPEPE